MYQEKNEIIEISINLNNAIVSWIKHALKWLKHACLVMQKWKKKNFDYKY